MAAAEERDGRNFRQTYYEKVGFKGVEEKRSLEMILNEKPLDVNRLTQFTCRFNLPDVHRERVWLLLLGCPPTRESGLFIANEQRRLTDDLEDALHVMNLHTCSKRDQKRGRTLTLMYLMETGCLRPGDVDQQLQSPDVLPLTAIANNLTANSGIRFENDYWILKEFIKLLNRIDQNEVRNRIRAELAAEEPVLFNHLNETASLSVIPCDWWLTCCFAGLISQPFLIKVWDKLVAGNANKVMSLAGQNLLKFRKDDLLSANDAKQIHKILQQTLSPCQSESLVKEVISQLSDV